MKIKEFVSCLNSYKFIAKETEPLLSDEDINLLIQESSGKKTQTYDRRIVSITEQCTSVIIRER